MFQVKQRQGRRARRREEEKATAAELDEEAQQQCEGWWHQCNPFGNSAISAGGARVTTQSSAGSMGILPFAAAALALMVANLIVTWLTRLKFWLKADVEDSALTFAGDFVVCFAADSRPARSPQDLSLIHISEPTRPRLI
eukprot:913318-Rhodomonas_salina.1